MRVASVRLPTVASWVRSRALLAWRMPAVSSASGAAAHHTEYGTLAVCAAAVPQTIPRPMGSAGGRLAERPVGEPQRRRGVRPAHHQREQAEQEQRGAVRGQRDGDAEHGGRREERGGDDAAPGQG